MCIDSSKAGHSMINRWKSVKKRVKNVAVVQTTNIGGIHLREGT